MSTSFSVERSRLRCLKYRKRILEISQRVTCHVAPAFSCIEILDVIYLGLKRPQDAVILSKGHGALAQYAVLEELGVIMQVALDRYCTPEGRLGAHPDRGNPGIEASTGSLGHGLGLAVGMAYAERLKGTDARVFVVCSDGEMESGATWEAAWMAAKLKLDNLHLFVDANGWGGMEPIERDFCDKFRSFGWGAINGDGHSPEEMLCRHSVRNWGKPFALICETVKGQGASFMVDAPIWHYRSPNAEEYATALEELGA